MVALMKVVLMITTMMGVAMRIRTYVLPRHVNKMTLCHMHMYVRAPLMEQLLSL